MSGDNNANGPCGGSSVEYLEERSFRTAWRKGRKESHFLVVKTNYTKLSKVKQQMQNVLRMKKLLVQYN